MRGLSTMRKPPISRSLSFGHRGAFDIDVDRPMGKPRSDDDGGVELAEVYGVVAHVNILTIVMFCGVLQ